MAPISRARLTELEGATVGSPAATLGRWRMLSPDVAIVFVGDGAVLYAADIARDTPSSRVQAAPDLAGVIGLLAVDRAADALDPAAVRPLYVRRPDVEVVRDEKRRGARSPAKDT